MTKIVSIGWYKVLPPKFGGQKGIALFNKYLSRFYPVIFLCSRDNEVIRDNPYRVSPKLPINKTQFLNPFCWRKIIKFLRESSATHLILEHPYHGIAGYFAKKIIGVKLIVHSHNIESLRFKEIGKWWWPIMIKYEKWVHQIADLSLFKTNQDLEYAVNHFKLPASKCMVIPYGVEKNKKSIDKLQARKLIIDRHNIPSECKLLLFAGTLDYIPNAKAVEVIYKEIAPAMNQIIHFPFKIIICGRNRIPVFHYLKKLRHPDIIMIGEAEDIENYFSAADLFINPVIIGGGIQTKTIDALSFNLNVVSTKNAAVGLPEYLSDKKIFINKTGTWNDYIQLIILALKNQENIPEKFYNHYSWESNINKLKQKIENIPNG